jgi:hypothetical protein
MANDSPYTKPENVRAIVQVRTENGMPYNSFPDADDPTIQRWINNRTGEAHLILARNGAAVPIDPAISEAHAALFAFLATLVEYGAAAILEGSPVAGQDPNARQSTANYYQTEYNRMLGVLRDTYDRDALIALGIATPVDPATVPAAGAAFGLAGNYQTDDRAASWLNSYPVRRGGTLPGGLGGV